MERRKLSEGRKLRLRSLDDLDGRTSSARMAFQLRAALASDLGGHDSLSTAKKALVNNVALLGAMLEDIGARFLAGEKVDPGAYATLANAQRRLLVDLGLERHARDLTPSLRSYVKGKAA